MTRVFTEKNSWTKNYKSKHFSLDKGHKLIANKTFRIHPQCLEHHLNILHTVSLSLVSTGQNESSRKGSSKHTLIQTNCLWFVFERWKSFFCMNIIGQVIKNFRTVFFKYGTFFIFCILSWGNENRAKVSVLFKMTV